MVGGFCLDSVDRKCSLRWHWILPEKEKVLVTGLSKEDCMRQTGCSGSSGSTKSVRMSCIPRVNWEEVNEETSRLVDFHTEWNAEALEGYNRASQRAAVIWPSLQRVPLTIQKETNAEAGKLEGRLSKTSMRSDIGLSQRLAESSMCQMLQPA